MNHRTMAFKNAFGMGIFFTPDQAIVDMSKDGPMNIDGAEEAKKMIKRRGDFTPILSENVDFVNFYPQDLNE